MRRLLAAVLAALVLFCGCAAKTNTGRGEDPFSSAVFLAKNTADDTFRRFVWISYLDIAPMLSGNRKAIEACVEEMAQNLVSLGITDAFVQVRAFGDALYPSSVYPSAARTTYPNLQKDIDVFETILNCFHGCGVRVHAWVNPYRLSTVSDDEYKTFADSLRAKDAVIAWEDGLYLNPASASAKETVLAGIEEILDRYPVDGVHFDDYFYPTTDAAFDAESYNAYLARGGDMSLADFRRFHVSDLVESAYRRVKEKDITLEFGVSPDGNLQRNYDVHYANVQLWGAGEGYVDYLCPQLYYGYENDAAPFSAALESWADVCHRCALVVGLGFYKVGTEDGFAGQGAAEWMENNDIIARQYADAVTRGCSGAAFYRYGSMFAPTEAVAASVSLALQGLSEVLAS